MDVGPGKFLAARFCAAGFCAARFCSADFSLQVSAHIPMHVVLPRLSFRGSNSPFQVDLSLVLGHKFLQRPVGNERSLHMYRQVRRLRPTGKSIFVEVFWVSMDCMVARRMQPVLLDWLCSGFSPVGRHNPRVVMSRYGPDRLQEGIFG